jgi:hypothetical protein
LSFTANFNEALDYENYMAYIKISGLEVYDSNSDKFLKLEKTETYPLNNTIESTGDLALGGSLGGSKDSISGGAETLGNIMVVAAPGVSGPFIQIV